MANRHRATTRYKYGVHKGKAIPQKEIQRRIAQSFGLTRNTTSKQPNTPTTPHAGDTIIVS